ncbi:MAG: cobalamin-dependent protein [Bacteroidota bacterium]|jgi:methanogenic corrinoid protein MtbC1|nr:cobalamin-dependent protein [Bacteroidota bacterium]
MPPAIPSEDILAYQDALRRGDKRACAEIVQRQVDRDVPLRSIFLALFQDGLYEIGRLWEENRISVAIEHLATSITLSLLHIVYPRLFRIPRTGRAAIVATAPGEQHYVGARLVADICELHGWDSHFVGSNTPLSEFRGIIEEKRPDALAVSVTLRSSLPSLLTLIDTVQAFAPDLPLIIGGQGVAAVDPAVLVGYPAVRHHRTLDEFESFLAAA